MTRPDAPPSLTWDSPLPVERRAAPRVRPTSALRASAVFVEPPAVDGAALEVLDVSRGGLGIEMTLGANLPAIGAAVVVELYLPETPVPCRLTGRVCHQDLESGAVRMGLTFDESTVGVGNKHRTAYEAYLRRCVAAAAAADGS